MKVPAAARSIAWPPPTEPVKLTKSNAPAPISAGGGGVVEKHVLEHIGRHPRRVEGPGQPFAHQRRLARVFQHHRIARDQRRCDGVDRGQIRIVPGRDHQHHALRHAGDVAAKGRAVFDHGRGQRPGGDVRHVGRAFRDPAEFAAKSDRAAHLPGQFGHDASFIAPDGRPVAHQRDARVEWAGGPFGLGGAGAGDLEEGGLGVKRGALGIDRAVDRGNAANRTGA